MEHGDVKMVGRTGKIRGLAGRGNAGRGRGVDLSVLSTALALVICCCGALVCCVYDVHVPLVCASEVTRGGTNR